ncbi:MAG: hypothetical protein OXT09_16955, partial [Myxococcales bacterium]|nr:hypothetical protein [Myxococcales bacterium]
PAPAVLTITQVEEAPPAPRPRVAPEPGSAATGPARVLAKPPAPKARPSRRARRSKPRAKPAAKEPPPEFFSF